VLDVVEAVRVPLLQVRRLEHPDVHPAVDEDVLLNVFDGVLLELLEGPVGAGLAEALLGVKHSIQFFA
jgi:hypothetical protein